MITVKKVKTGWVIDSPSDDNRALYSRVTLKKAGIDYHMDPNDCPAGHSVTAVDLLLNQYSADRVFPRVSPGESHRQTTTQREDDMVTYFWLCLAGGILSTLAFMAGLPAEIVSREIGFYLVLVAGLLFVLSAYFYSKTEKK